MKNTDRSVPTVELKSADSSVIPAILPPVIDDDGPIIVLKGGLDGEIT